MEIKKEHPINLVLKVHPETEAIFEKHNVCCKNCREFRPETIECFSKRNNLNVGKFVNELRKATKNELNLLSLKF